MRLAITVMTGILLATAGSSLHAQSAPAASPKTTAKPAVQAAAPAAKPAAQATPAAAKPAPPAAAAKTAAKPAAQTPAPKAPAPKVTAPATPAKPAAAPKSVTAAAKPAKKPAVKKAASPAPAKTSAAPEASEAKVSRRDPFESLTSRQEAAARAGANLPPGKAGLQVGTLRLDGIVRAPNGMIAVVTNPQARTYFLREGDQLYDGRVEKIAMDGVSFHEVGKDAFGKPVERQVNKRIYSSAGEQQ
jgi:Tfp pilus assembly protein PilP